ncbi:MAG: hypothetical protein WCQ65_11890 [Fermentimonas sp.]
MTEINNLKPITVSLKTGLNMVPVIFAENVHVRVPIDLKEKYAKKAKEKNIKISELLRCEL